MSNDGISRVLCVIQPLRQLLLEHPLYRDLRNPGALRTFMEYHIFAVWDFMSLLKTLQQHFCCLTVPWVPKHDSVGCRFVNEIVLGEETDEDGRDGYGSHYELYHRAMTEFGADTTRIDRFIELLRSGSGVRAALRAAEVPKPIGDFVGHTFQVIETGDLCRVASAFTFGREDLLPDVFGRIIAETNQSTDGKLDSFEFYLRRHVQLDADEHGPMASRMITSLCGVDSSKWQSVEEAAFSALRARLNLWDAIRAHIRGLHFEGS